MKLAGLKRTASEVDRRATVEQKLKKEKDTPAMLYGDTYLSDFEKMVCESIVTRKERTLIADETYTLLENLFYSIDSERTNVIDINLFKDSMPGVSEFKRKQFDEMMKFLDIDLDRKVSFEDYLKIMVLRAMRRGIKWDKQDMKLRKLLGLTKKLLNDSLKDVINLLKMIIDP